MRPAPTGALVSAELRLAGRLDARFFALLAAIEATGSINRAAAAAGYSYKGAWLVLESAGNLARTPLLLTMLCEVYAATGGLPANRGKLLEAFVSQRRAWERQRYPDAWIATGLPALSAPVPMSKPCRRCTYDPFSRVRASTYKVPVVGSITGVLVIG